MRLDTKVVIPDTVLLQEVDDETILLDIDTQEYFSLNEVGSVFYHLLKEESNLSIVLSELEELFEVPKEELQKDLLVFVEALKDKGLLNF